MQTYMLMFKQAERLHVILVCAAAPPSGFSFPPGGGRSLSGAVLFSRGGGSRLKLGRADLL